MPSGAHRVSLIGSAPRILALGLASIAVMTPWPLLGILLLHTQFDRASEGFMFLGGITLFPLMILALLGNPSEEFIFVIVSLVWLVAALLPGFLLRKRLVSWSRVAGLLGAQSLFALGQAMMGALLIIGKSI